MYDTVPKFARRLSTVTPSVRTGVSRRIAELRVRLRKRIASPRKLISRLGVAVTCITVVAPPALYAVISTNQLRQHALRSDVEEGPDGRPEVVQPFDGPSVQRRVVGQRNPMLLLNSLGKLGYPRRPQVVLAGLPYDRIHGRASLARAPRIWLKASLSSW